MENGTVIQKYQRALGPNFHLGYHGSICVAAGLFTQDSRVHSFFQTSDNMHDTVYIHNLFVLTVCSHCMYKCILQVYVPAFKSESVSVTILWLSVSAYKDRGHVSKMLISLPIHSRPQNLVFVFFFCLCSKLHGTHLNFGSHKPLHIKSNILISETSIFFFQFRLGEEDVLREINDDQRDTNL